MKKNEKEIEAGQRRKIKRIIFFLQTKVMNFQEPVKVKTSS
jgi:hypothetical protein